MQAVCGDQEAKGDVSFSHMHSTTYRRVINWTEEEPVRVLDVTPNKHRRFMLEAWHVREQRGGLTNKTNDLHIHDAVQPFG